MRFIVLAAQIAIPVLLIGLILLQAKGSGFGQSFTVSESFSTRRGVEKLVFKFTVILVAIFALVSLGAFFV